MKTTVPCSFFSKSDESKILQRERNAIVKLARIEGFESATAQPEGTVVAVSGVMRFFLDLSGRIDIQEERVRVQNSIEKTKAEKSKINGLLSNQDFLGRAKPDVVEKNKARLAELNSEIASLMELLTSLQ